MLLLFWVSQILHCFQELNSGLHWRPFGHEPHELDLKVLLVQVEADIISSARPSGPNRDELGFFPDSRAIQTFLLLRGYTTLLPNALLRSFSSFQGFQLDQKRGWDLGNEAGGHLFARHRVLRGREAAVELRYRLSAAASATDRQEEAQEELLLQHWARWSATDVCWCSQNSIFWR